MYVVRGRAPTLEADRDTVAELRDIVAAEDRPLVRLWRPHRHLAFGPRDVRHDGYQAAAAAARQRGFPPVERSVGGHPVAHTGSTLAFLKAIPLEDPRQGLRDRYEETLGLLQEALRSVGVDPTRGEPADTFCPGDYSLSADGKIIGLAQRVTSDVAITSGVAVVDDPKTMAEVLEVVYDQLGLAFDPDSVGAIADAGGPADVATVARAIEAQLVGDADATIVSVQDRPTVGRS